eukprot:Hpha_TRINITY_DN15479_c5_g11::TRINITY_DN15479_c5_g11_i1::g.173299::m.173299
MTDSPNARSKEVVSVTRDELLRLHDRNQELVRVVSQLTEDNQKLSDELDRFSQTVVSLQVSKAEEDKEGGKKKSRLDGVREKLKHGKRDVAELQVENELLKAKLTVAESENGRCAGLQLTLQALQESIREHAERGVGLAAKCEELERYKSSVAATAPDAAALADAQARVAELEPLAAQVESAAAESSRLAAEGDRLRRELAEKDGEWERRLQQQHEAAEGSRRAERALAEKAVKEREQRVAELSTLLGQKDEILRVTDDRQGETRERVAALEAELAQQRATVAAYQEQVGAMTAKLGTLGETENEAHTAQLALERLRGEAALAERELRQERDTRQAAEASAAELSAELTRTRELLQEAQKAQESEGVLRCTVDHQRANIDSLKEAVRMRDEDIRQLKEFAGQAQEHVTTAAALREQLEELQERSTAEAAVQREAAEREGAASAAALAEAQGLLEAVREELKECKAEAGVLREQAAAAEKLRVEVEAFDQRLDDQDGEHRIEMRKRDTLIRELQRDLAAAHEAARRAPSPDPVRDVRRPSPPQTPPSHAQTSETFGESATDPSGISGLPDLSRRSPKAAPAPMNMRHTAELRAAMRRNTGTASSLPMCVHPAQVASPGGAETSADLERENEFLIQRCADLQQEKWRLDDRVAYLEEDNTKKGNILAHWINGPAAAQLVRSSGDALLRPAPVASASHKHSWRPSFGLGGGSSQSVAQQARDKSQEVLQDALADNIRMQTELDTARDEVVRLRAALESAAGVTKPPVSAETEGAADAPAVTIDAGEAARD